MAALFSLFTDIIDYNFTSTVLVLSPGVKVNCTNVGIIPDEILEHTEDLTIVLSSSDPAVNITLPNQAAVIIVDDDGMVPM